MTTEIETASIRCSTLDALCEGSDLEHCRAEAWSFLRAIMHCIEDKNWNPKQKAMCSFVALPVARRLCGIPGWQDLLKPDAVVDACEPHLEPAERLEKTYPRGHQAPTYMVGVVMELYEQWWPNE